MIIASSCVCLLLFLVYFSFTAQHDALQRYEQQTRADVEIAASNINYYLNNCISATKSVYTSKTLLQKVTSSKNSFPTTSERSEVFSYMRSIGYSLPSAQQIYLAVPDQKISFLYLPRSLQTSFSSLSNSPEEADLIPTMSDIYIRLTHRISTYNHIVSFQLPESRTELVFTIWLPVSNLPYSIDSRAYVAIDMPISFILDNCRILDKSSESVYVVDNTGFIIASNNDSCVMGNITDLGFSPEILNTSDTQIVNGGICITARLDAAYFNWSIIRTTPLSSIYDHTWKQTMVLVGLFCCLIVFLLIFNIFYITRYTHPLVRLTQYMQSLIETRDWSGGGHLTNDIRYSANDEIGVLVKMFETMVSSMHSFTVRQYELELSYMDSMLNMLQAQINPHFIYNTIQCFATNALRNKDRTQYNLLTSFGKMLHYSMILDPVLVPLKSEIDYIHRYLSLQEIRFGTSPTIEFDISEEGEQIMIPKLTIQPLVENSVSHGMLFRHECGYLRVAASVQDGRLCVAVTDNGSCVSPETVQRIQTMLEAVVSRLKPGADPSPGGTSFSFDLKKSDSADPERSTGIGVQNVFTRLILFFGDCQLLIEPNDLGGTTSSFAIPIMPSIPQRFSARSTI